MIAKKEEHHRCDALPAHEIVSHLFNQIKESHMEQYDMYARHEAEVAAWESKFPKCFACDEAIIEGDDYVELEFDEVYHTECFLNRYQKTMPDWREL